MALSILAVGTTMVLTIFFIGCFLIWFLTITGTIRHHFGEGTKPPKNIWVMIPMMPLVMYLTLQLLHQVGQFI